MESYSPIDQKALSPASRKVMGLLGLFGLAYGIYALNYMWIITCLLLALVSVFGKQIAVTSAGICITYRIAFYTRVDQWPMAEIEYLHRERGKAPGQVMLHFTRGAMSRRLLFSESDGEKVMALAKRVNPNIYMDEAGRN